MSMLPFDDRDGQIWFDGELMSVARGQGSCADPRLHYASCVFEGERVYDGSVFKLTEHSERLAKSAEILGFKLPYSVAEIDAATNLVLKTQGYTDAYVRPVAWRGSEMMGVSAQHNKIHVAIAGWEWPAISRRGAQARHQAPDSRVARGPPPTRRPPPARRRAST